MRRAPPGQVGDVLATLRARVGDVLATLRAREPSTAGGDYYDPERRTRTADASVASDEFMAQDHRAGSRRGSRRATGGAEGAEWARSGSR
eukprot:CAMPEP_0204179716 /NCGR_PEP_ID=MMETSP0361-20130328/50395_1 /ASSEMBLY_ACC=CAM_ASM_000343 /TAXON_ID=268821 /ORGANISM="Scrippsiella Hangoei, Strain SHTV-5" /LENGTH=89 /DNA_ID=CAMNT_0051139027 /DNA_START=266 /DNA_END=533 /DNA_ORIENTATION=+